MDTYLYYGNLGLSEKQYAIEEFVGLALEPTHDREIRHDAQDPLPFSDGSISKIQSQDVFEHLPQNCIPRIFNDIFRVLKGGGVFRLSVPDYRSPLLQKRSVYDASGAILGDLMMGASVSYDPGTKTPRVNFRPGGNSHLWFPKYEIILHLILNSDLRFSQEITFYQYFLDDTRCVVKEIPENEMHVQRCVPNDPRANGMPISIVVDFVK